MQLPTGLRQGLMKLFRRYRRPAAISVHHRIQPVIVDGRIDCCRHGSSTALLPRSFCPVSSAAVFAGVTPAKHVANCQRRHPQLGRHFLHRPVGVVEHRSGVEVGERGPAQRQQRQGQGESL